MGWAASWSLDDQNALKHDFRGCITWPSNHFNEIKVRILSLFLGEKIFQSITTLRNDIELFFTLTGKDFQVQIKVMGQGDYRYEMTQVSSQEFQDVREKIYDCVSTHSSLVFSFQYSDGNAHFTIRIKKAHNWVIIPLLFILSMLYRHQLWVAKVIDKIWINQNQSTSIYINIIWKGYWILCLIAL